MSMKEWIEVKNNTLRAYRELVNGNARHKRLRKAQHYYELSEREAATVLDKVGNAFGDTLRGCSTSEAFVIAKLFELRSLISQDYGLQASDRSALLRAMQSYDDCVNVYRRFCGASDPQTLRAMEVREWLYRSCRENGVP